MIWHNEAIELAGGSIAALTGVYSPDAYPSITIKLYVEDQMVILYTHNPSGLVTSELNADDVYDRYRTHIVKWSTKLKNMAEDDIVALIQKKKT